MDHDAKDSHLCGTSIIQFDGSLTALPFVGLVVPSKIDETIAEVSHKFSLALSSTRADSPWGLELICEKAKQMQNIGLVKEDTLE